jgi:hypothetical protein
MALRDWFELISTLVTEGVPSEEKQNENLRQYGSRDLAYFDLKLPARQPDAQQVRALATGGILFYTGDTPIKLLPQLKAKALVRQQEALAQWWGVSNTQDALDTLGRLRNEGHREKFERELKKKAAYWQAEFAKKPFLRTRAVTSVGAWDYGRLVNVARWSYDCGYLSWEQAWEFIEAGSQLAQQEYTSWEGFATGFLAGRLMWSPESETHGDITDAARALLKAPDGLWSTIPWEAGT